MTLFDVGLSTIETLLRSIGRADDDAGIRTRLKYLQRMSFPSGSNSGRGRRAAYDLDQLLQVLVCFQLIQLGLPPTRSLRTIRTGWQALRGPLAFGWLARADPVLLARRPLLVMERSALDDGRGGEDPNEPVGNPLRPVPFGRIVDRMAAGSGDVVGIVLDPAALALALADALAAPGSAVAVAELDEAFAAYWHETVGLPIEEWTPEETGSEPPLGEIVPFRPAGGKATRRGRPAA